VGDNSSGIAPDIPAMLRRAAINTALGSARSFYTALSKWRKRKEQAQLKGKKYTIRPPVPQVLLFLVLHSLNT
jgi:hypothetical protein